LSELTLAELQQFSPTIGSEVFAVLTLEGSVAARDLLGGTAPARVREAARLARVDLEKAAVLL
jgi:argininosuccinate lyase